MAEVGRMASQRLVVTCPFRAHSSVAARCRRATRLPITFERLRGARRRSLRGSRVQIRRRKDLASIEIGPGVPGSSGSDGTGSANRRAWRCDSLRHQLETSESSSRQFKTIVSASSGRPQSAGIARTACLTVGALLLEQRVKETNLNRKVTHHEIIRGR